MAKKQTVTPLMQQHQAMKQKFPDAILLFRVGDFYETFGSDAVIVADVLGIALTKRNNGNAASEALAGFPHHAIDTYLHKLVRAGHRVAICDQLEDPKQAKGIVKRGVTEVVTPGIATNDKLLDNKQNNFLSGLYQIDNQFGIAFIDVSTGECYIAEGNVEYIETLIQNFKPAEIVLQKTYYKTFQEKTNQKYYTYTLDEWIFTEKYTTEILLQQFQTHSFKGFGVEHLTKGLIAAGCLLHYLKETEHHNLKHINIIHRIDKNDFLWMDKFTIQNLELLPQGINKITLSAIIDKTKSPMGARLLKRWLMFPLQNIYKINERLDTVSFFLTETLLRDELQKMIKDIGDIERFVAKIPLKKITPRDVVQIGKSLSIIKKIKHLLSQTSQPYLIQLADAINPCDYIQQKIEKTMEPMPAVHIQKGGCIKAGVNTELDEWRSIINDSKQHLNALLQKAIQETGISSLKIDFNNVFGYYLEVSHTHKNKVPTEWMRKQTLTNAERYITPELKIYEEKILHAEEKILALEIKIFDHLLNDFQDYIALIQINAHSIATMDCLLGFAQLAHLHQYICPTLHQGFELHLQNSRHPVIEQCLPPDQAYIPNDILLNEEQQIIILTGPNMSGKSAILRQTALITLLAHIGCFVPCSNALIPLTDKIFTRVGASDNLSGGESTFMVEMNETASIINNISPHSLVLLDEIGRGTSTFDGVAIAWSIIEYLHQHTHKAKIIFATHYHELNDLEHQLPHLKNYHISHQEIDSKIIFLRKLTPGASHKSFGIHVAKMAGFPNDILKRAQHVLTYLQDTKNNHSAQPLLFPPNINIVEPTQHTQQYNIIKTFIAQIDINTISPVDALLKLNEIKKIIQNQ